MTVPGRDVEFTVCDGTILRGWHYPTQEKSPCIILSHGVQFPKPESKETKANRLDSLLESAIGSSQPSPHASKSPALPSFFTTTETGATATAHPDKNPIQSSSN